MPNRRPLLLTVLLLLVWNAASYAQQPDTDQVKAAIDAYHAAIGSLDIAKMEPLWAHDANVMLVNPRAFPSAGPRSRRIGKRPSTATRNSRSRKRRGRISSSTATWRGRPASRLQWGS